MAIEPIEVEDLTTVAIDGTGVFDKLMQTMRLHLAEEFNKGRLKGQEYSQVLSSSFTAVLQNSVMFLLQKDEAANKAALIEAQIILTQKQGELLDKQIAREELEADLIAAKVNLTNEQALMPEAEIRRINAQITSAGFADLLTQAQTAKTEQDVLTAVEQTLLIKKQVEQATQEILNLQQTLLNLVAQECLLRAQYDLTMEQKLNTTAQTALVQARTSTERANVLATGVDADSVIGRQKALYKAQSDGFTRDAEQKAAKLLIDSWNVRRTTDSGTVADGTNKLYDPSIGRLVDKLLAGVNA